MSQKRRHESALHDGAADPGAASKRRRMYTEDDAILARIYENLASEVSDDRLRAAKDLVARLEPSSQPSPEAVETALTRLVRGLCSSRKAARFGFFVALTEILRLQHRSGGKSVDELIDFAEQKTRADGQSSRQEKRDHLLGLFFNYKAIVESSVLWQADVSQQTWSNYLQHVFQLAKDNVWIRDKCGVMLCEAIVSLQSNDGKDKYVELLLQHLSKSGLAKTAEGVAVWITARTVCSNSVLPSGIWRQDDPLCNSERQILVKILKGSSVDGSTDGSAEHKSASGFATPTPSFAWDIVLKSILGNCEGEDEKEDASKSTEFEKFWLDIVDNNLFSSSSSHERKAWGFQILAKMLYTAPSWALTSLFSPNLMKSLINQRKGADRNLHQAALAPLREIQSRASKEPETAFKFVIELTSKNGTIEFDHITKTKTVEGTIAAADDETMNKIVSHLDELIMHPSVQTDQEANRERRLIADVLVSVSKGYAQGQLDSDTISQPDAWLHRYFNLFIKYAYFMPNESAVDNSVPKPPLQESTRDVFRTRLLSCLANFASSKVDEERSFPGVVVSNVRDISKSAPTLNLVFQADHQVLRLVRHAHKTQERLFSALKSPDQPDAKKPMFRALNLLWSQTLLQVYNGDPDAASMLEELGEMLPSLLSASGDSDEKDESGFEMLLEVLLSFVSKPSALSRMLAEEVFAAFASEVTSGAFASMLDILEKKESIKGQEELFDQNLSGDEVEEDDEDDDEDEDKDENSDIDGEDASDVEMLSDDEEDKEDDDDEDDEEDDEEEEGEDDDDVDDEAEDDEVLQFELKLAEALGTAKLDPDAEDDESSDSDMDDDQMLELDGHLAKIFKEQKGNDKSQKKERKDAKETVINFKNRVLDLLLIYIKQQHASPLALDIITPLLRLIRTTSSKQVSEKSFDLLKKYFDASKGKELPAPSEPAEVWQLLRDVHDEVSKADSKIHNTACTRASLFLARVLTAADSAAYRKVADVYADTQEKWCTEPKSNVPLSFFQEWLNWSNDMRKQRGVVQQQQQQQSMKNNATKKQEKSKQKNSKKSKSKRK